MRLNPATRHGYEIMTALRGPDFVGADSVVAHNLKLLTTAVIRHFVGVTPGCGAFVNFPDCAILFWTALPPEARAAVAALWRTEHHFRNHTLYALYCLASRHYNRKTWRAVTAYYGWLTQDNVLGGY